MICLYKSSVKSTIFLSDARYAHKIRENMKENYNYLLNLKETGKINIFLIKISNPLIIGISYMLQERRKYIYNP